jgi:hypothetical protein
MRRREFIALFGASITWPFAALAQQPGRTYRLGFLVLAPRDVPLNVHLLDELRRLGFVEGQNLTVEFRAYGLHPDLISQYAAELVNARVDVIVVAGEEAIRALQQATKTIPIVAIGGDLLGRSSIALIYSITSSARPRSGSGTAMPSAFAVLRLMTNSNLVTSCTGKSAAFSPLRIRPT